jgi:hypothetical protein
MTGKIYQENSILLFFTPGKGVFRHFVSSFWLDCDTGAGHHANTQSTDDSGNGGIAGVAVAGQGFVQAFAVNSDQAGHFTHASFTSQKTQSGEKNLRVIVKECVGQVFVDFGLSFKVVKRVPGSCFHRSFLHIPRHDNSASDVRLLGGFVTATQQHNQFAMPDDVVEPISLPNVDPQFKNTATNPFVVAQITGGDTGKSPGNRQHRLPVP